MGLVINDWHVCDAENKLRIGNRELLLQPLCMSLLVFMAKHPGRIIDRHEIIQQVWQGRVVSEDALNNCIRKIRCALGDDAKNPKLIETINRKGYRLIATVKDNSENTLPPKTVWSFLTAKPLLKYSMLASLMSGIVYFLPVEIDVINIYPDMSPAEKQQQYDLVMEKTAKGGHIIKIDQKE